MKKKLTILLLALMLTASALAEAYEGTTAPLSTAVVTAGFPESSRPSTPRRAAMSMPAM